jgi:hypothetical protein
VNASRVPKALNAGVSDTGWSDLRRVDARQGGAQRPRACPHVWSGGVDVIGQPATQMHKKPVAIETVVHDNGGAICLANR